ncbi:MAG: hypothetical protein K9M56_06020 [Victivallales bacterium]|nr:hypothetical protein [Victivallales bacterium]
MSLYLNKKERIPALITLLEDEDSSVSSAAMKEMLRLSSMERISNVIKKMQDSTNPKLRQRAHQLQSIIKIRAVRTRLSSRLINPKRKDLLSGLIELHLLWYDRDNEENLKNQVNSFIAKARISGLETFKDIAVFFKKNDFITAKNSELEPDSYCIGSVLDTKIGTDILLCSIIALIAESIKIEYSIIAFDNKFFIYDNKNCYIDPMTWKTKTVTNKKKINNSKRFYPDSVFRFIIYQLLVCSICTASYRYVYTIGNCLKNALKEKNLSDILDAPYSGEV